VVPGGLTAVTVVVNTAGMGEGIYTATLRIDSDDPAEPSLAVPVTLTVTPGCVPVAGASFSFAPGQPSVSQTVTFSGTVTAGDTPIVYTWNFGDETNSTGQVAYHAYQNNGTYQVIMTATNACSEVTAPPQTITVGVHQIYLPMVLKNR